MASYAHMKSREGRVTTIPGTENLSLVTIVDDKKADEGFSMFHESVCTNHRVLAVDTDLIRNGRGHVGKGVM